MIDDLSFRESILFKARERYMPHRTNNITVALELYLKHIATEDEQVPVFISSKTRPRNWVDKLDRPNCPSCGRSLLLRAVTTPKGRANREGYQTCWECLDCGFEKYSLKSIADRLRSIN